MIAVQDQENLLHSYQQAATSKPLNHRARGEAPKTPGNKYPKTPLKVPLRDENAPPTGLGDKKSMLGTRFKALENLVPGTKPDVSRDKDDFITPIVGHPNRAPLAIKTTNAKTRPFQTPARNLGNKDAEKTQMKPMSTHRQKQRKAHVDTVKLNVLGDQPNALSERDVEYCPPKPKDLPYESDDFPEGCLDYGMLKGPNLMRGWQSFYHDRVDENGVPLKERRFNDAVAEALKEGEERIRKAVEEAEWTVADVPETFINPPKDIQNAKADVKTSKPTSIHRGPTTAVSRRAVAALSIVGNAPPVSKPSNTKLKHAAVSRGKRSNPPAPVYPLDARSTAAGMASRSTIGYTKGRSTLHALSTESNSDPKSSSSTVTRSGTIMPISSPAQKQDPTEGISEWRRLRFLRIFDTDEEDVDESLRGELPDILRNSDDENDFVLTLDGV